MLLKRKGFDEGEVREEYGLKVDGESVDIKMIW